MVYSLPGSHSQKPDLAGCGSPTAPGIFLGGTHAPHYTAPMKTVIGSCLIALFASVATATDNTNLNVVIVVIDGPRYTETWGEANHAHIPVLSKKLAPLGAVNTNFFNDGVTKTIPGHTAITAGHYQQISNTGRENPTHPTLLQRVRKHANLPVNKVWLIATKDKLEVLSNTTDKTWKGQYMPATWCGKKGKGLRSGYGNDADTIQEVVRVIKEHQPRLLVVNFREPDSSGHRRNWDSYLKGIRDTDAYLGTIYDTIQSTPGMKDNTILFMSNDHGRHLDDVKDGFVNHGCDCKGCRHIVLYATGPGIKKGAIIGTQRGQIDIAATTAHIFGLTIETAKGKVMTELFDSN